MRKPISLIALLFPFLIIITFHGCTKDDGPIAPPEEHFEAIGMYFTTSGIEVVSILRGVTTDTLKAPLGGIGAGIDVQFYDKNENIIDPPTNPDLTLAWKIDDTTVVSVWQHPGEEGGYEFHLRGLKEGTTHIEFMILHDNHADYTSGKIPVIVEHDEHAHGEPVGLKLYDEDSGSLLATVNQDGTVTGSIDVAVNDTTDHIELKFFDANGVEFQPSVLDHSLGYAIANLSIAGIIPPDASEPWAFKIYGIASGSTAITLELNHDGHVEDTFSPIPINVQ
jgi:hypothetical protein